jgi:thiol:disulfide interchange protein DsbA
MLAAASMFASSIALGQLMEGRDYQTLRAPRPTDNPAKIEVLEYFSWGCSHCYELYPFMSKWEARVPKDVAVVKSAVTVGFDQWMPLSRAFYALDYSGDVKRLDGLFFKAIHEERINLFSDDNIAAWVERQGIDKKKFSAMAKSMGVDAKVKQAEANSRSIPIDGTPTLIVDGKYILVAAGAKSYADWTSLLDQLIAKVRAERAKTGKN